MSLPEPEAPLAETIHEAAKESKAAMFFVLIMATVQLISVAVFTYNAIQDREEEKVQQALNRKLKILQTIYQRKDHKYEEIDYALINLRGAILDMQFVCKDKGNLTPDKRKKKLDLLIEQRLRGKYALLQAYGSAQVVFGEKVFNKIRDFIAETEKTETFNYNELCTSVNNLPDSEMRKQTREINGLMYNSLEQTEKMMSEVILKSTGEKVD